MANRRRGEISAEIGGRRRTLCLTLGALAGLEARFGENGLAALARRLENGVSARDLLAIISAGLAGAGEDLDEAGLGALTTDGALAGFAFIAADLLAATFGALAPETEAANPP